MNAFVLFLLATSLGADSFTATVDKKVYPDEYFPQVAMDTSMGRIVVELDRRRAPVTVNNFLSYMEKGDYNGTLFHRVIDAFVVQGGGYRPGWAEIDLLPPIMNESGNGLTNQAYSIAMARQEDPHSATSQFYFNLIDNESLDPNRRNWGYSVFGQVVEGQEILDQIGQVPTDFNADFGSADVPVENVVLEKLELVPSG